VLSYNNSREVFPNSLLASWFNFEAAQMLEAPPAEKREPPKVSFT
jgi:LemA protein